jgi:3-oxoacyl-[acyl-carrier protein] reductase
MRRVKGKVVIVTGGAAGIGLATARRFAQEAAASPPWDVKDGEAQSGIFKAGRHQPRFRRGRGGRIASRWPSIRPGQQRGILRDGQLIKYKDGPGRRDERAVRFGDSVNLKVFTRARRSAPHDPAGCGVVLNASSVVGLYGNFGQTNYVATKAGVIGMTKVWARELGKYRVRVNAVAPGFIATEMIRQMPEKIQQTLIGRTPLGRMGQPEDVANAYAWLASDQASFITGAVLGVDGGAVTGT